MMPGEAPLNYPAPKTTMQMQGMFPTAMPAAAPVTYDAPAPEAMPQPMTPGASITMAPEAMTPATS